MRSPEEIRKILLENNITGYRIEKELGLTQVGADKFLNGETKKPIKKNLEIYNSYINSNFEFQSQKVNENPASYKKEEKLQPQEAEKAINILVRYEKELEKYILFKTWKERLQMEAKNEGLLEYLNSLK